MRLPFLPLLIATLPSTAFPEIILRGNGVLTDSSLSGKKAAQPTGKALERHPAGDDIALLEEGDIMHGTFGGIKNGLLWERNDIDRPIRFGLPSIRQIVRNGGRAVKLHKHTSFLTLVSGDRIPGEIISLDEKSIVIKSEIVGELTIPRAHLKSIAPNPFDGKLFYSGPYVSDGWAILGNKQKPQPEDEEKKEKKENKAGKEAEPAESSPWIHSGASFYNLGADPLVFPDAELPDVGRISFKVEWKGRLNLTLALLSDFTRVLPVEEEKEAEAEEEEEEPPAALEGNEKEKEEPEAPKTRKERLVDFQKGKQFQTIPWLETEQQSNPLNFGSGYTLTLYSSYPYLSRNSFSENGQPVSKRMSTVRSSVSLSDQGEAEIEIRYNREKALLMLFINDSYAAQWNDLAGMPGNGSGFGIINTSMAKLKLSEVVFTSWNGMKDNAQSMTHPDKDVTLLVNGTDRFSGDLLKIADGKAHIKSDYLTAQIPITDIAKIALKTSGATDLEAEDLPENLTWNSEPLTILYRPFGVIKLNPDSADRDSISGTSPFLGEIKADLSSSSLLRFIEGSLDLSDWFDDL